MHVVQESKNRDEGAMDISEAEDVLSPSQISAGVGSSLQPISGAVAGLLTFPLSLLCWVFILFFQWLPVAIAKANLLP